MPVNALPCCGAEDPLNHAFGVSWICQFGAQRRADAGGGRIRAGRPAAATGRVGAAVRRDHGPVIRDRVRRGSLASGLGARQARAMPADAPSPIRPTDDEARRLARSLIDGARFGALAVVHPDSGMPHVSRVGIGTDPEGGPVTLISELSLHTRALRAVPRACVLLGEPAPRGDPLTHPRLSLDVLARFVPRGPEHEALRTAWLAQHPKARLYLDFADFSLVRLAPVSAALNGGFGKAFVLTAEDLARR